MNTANTPFFAPQLFISNGITDISFYTKAFGAVLLRQFTNDDGSIHVAELSINGAMFHLHEVTNSKAFTPSAHNGVTTIIGLFVDDVDAVMASAIAAGAKLVLPAQDYDYGYRQGEVQDPFGHIWMIDMVI